MFHLDGFVIDCRIVSVPLLSDRKYRNSDGCSVRKNRFSVKCISFFAENGPEVVKY